jgi:4-carboxymuconolactone decarboxylase
MSDYDQSPNYRRGLNLVKEMLGDRFLAGLTASAESGAFAADCASIAIESAFGAVWSRPGLARRDRSLVTLGILIATGKSAELKNHVRAGLNNGLSVEELQEVLIQAFPYCGFPCVAEAIEATTAVLRERGLIDDTTQSAKERGLL